QADEAREQGAYEQHYREQARKQRSNGCGHGTRTPDRYGGRACRLTVHVRDKLTFRASRVGLIAEERVTGADVRLGEKRRAGRGTGSDRRVGSEASTPAARRRDRSGSTDQS